MEAEIRTACERCGTEADIENFDGWKLRIEDNQIKAMLCPDCVSPEEIVGSLATAIEAVTMTAPILGSFKPVLPSESIVESRTNGYYSDYWLELEMILRTFMSEYGPALLRFDISSKDYKGYWFEPIWNAEEISALEIAGDTPSKKLKLSVYQVRQLSKMGFLQRGEKEIRWRLDLSKPETTFENVARIISHTFEHGYMLKPARVNAMSPILDVDLRDLKKNND